MNPCTLTTTYRMLKHNLCRHGRCLVMSKYTNFNGLIIMWDIQMDKFNNCKYFTSVCFSIWVTVSDELSPKDSDG